MALQTKGTTTNMTKLVSWDIDDYYKFSDSDGCIVCLTSRDKYLLRNALRQMEWTTRWTSDTNTAMPDISVIAENIGYKMSQSACMDLCKLIIDCIDTTPELQQLIASTSLGSSIVSTTTRNPDIEFTNVLDGNIGCDKDSLFGAMTGIVDLYDNLADDLIEILVASANTTARLGDAIESIPVIGSFPFDDILQFVESFLDDLQQNYDSAYTVALRNQFRCDLFCLAQPNCRLTFTEVFNYYNDQLITQMIAVDVQDVVDYLTVGAFAGTELVLAFNAFVASIFMFGGDIIGIQSAKLISMVSAMFNDPDSDWTLLCDDCVVCQAYDFSIDEQGWEGLITGTFSPRAIYHIAEGFGANPSELRGQVGISLGFVGSIDSVVVTLDMPITGDKNWQLYAGGVLIENASNVSGSSYTFSVPNGTLTDPRIAVFANSSSASGAGIPLSPYKIISVVACGVDLPIP